MKKAVKFWIAFFLALGAMISFSPRTSRAREAMLDNNEIKSGISQHFEAAWNHLAMAVDKHG